MNIAEIPRQVPRKHRQQLKMLGLNATNDYADGELEDCTGISTEGYPYITVADVPDLTELEAMSVPNKKPGRPEGDRSYFKDVDVKLVYGVGDNLLVAGKNIITNDIQTWYGHPAFEGKPAYFRRIDNKYDDYGVNVCLTDDFPKQVVQINSKICIFPDCVYLDTNSNRTILERLGRKILIQCSTGKVVFGSDKDGVFVRFPARWNIDLRELFADKLKAEDEFKDELYVKDGIGFDIRVVGCINPERDGIREVVKVGKRAVWFDGTAQFWDSGEKITGPGKEVYLCDAYIDDEGGVTDDLPLIPPIDYVCSHDNRLYGCSSVDQTIYVSALGDPSDWFSFENDLKAYAVAVSSGGNFTGCCASNGYVIFTKQHCIHKLMGSVPSEFYLHTLDVEGAAEGMGLSMCNCGGTIVYVGEHGLYTYNGGYTGRLSKALDPKLIKNPSCCFDGKRYLLTCNYYTANKKHLFDFDLEHGICVMRDIGDYGEIAHIRDRTFVAHSGSQIYDEGLPTQRVERLNKLMDLKSGEPCEFEITYKPFIDTISGSYHSETEIFEKKRYFKLYVRCIVPEGAGFTMSLDILDEKDEPIPEKHRVLGAVNGPFRGVKTFTFMTDRFDDVQLYIAGMGYVTICSIQREYQQKESSR